MCGLASNEDPITDGRWSAYSSWYVAAGQLLKFQIVKLMEGNELAGAISQTFHRLT